MDTLVSVIMPTYNRAEFIGKAIDSVLAQDYKHLELIIIDDGSTDDTKEIVESYLSDKILYYYQDNSGQSVARNNGINHANGKYIAFLDSDNIYNPGKISTQVAFLNENSEYQVIYGDDEFIDENGNTFSTKNMQRYSGFIYDKLLINNIISHNTVMARKYCFEEMGGFNEFLSVADDYELWLRFSTRYRFYYMPVLFVKYRVMENQISTDKEKRFESNEIIIRRSMEQNSELVNKKLEKYAMCRFYTRRGAYKAATGKIREAMKDYFMALQFKFFCKYPWRAMARAIILRR